MSAIESQHGSAFGTGEVQNVLVRHGLPGSARFIEGHHIVSQPAQFLHDRQRKILIGIQPRHVLSRLVFTDLRFDFVKYWYVKPGNISTGGGYTFLGGGPMVNSPCVVGTDPAQGCTFTKIDPAFDITAQVSNQWGAPWARRAQDLNGDGNNDLVFGTYASGGASASKIYVLFGNGDGKFQTPPTQMFTHPGNKGPANAFIFADFNNDTVGDVIVGFDDDGDAGAAWLYPGTDSGVFSTESQKIIDLNPNCNSGCSDKTGVSHAAQPFDFNFDGNLDIVVGHIFCNGNWGCDVFDSAKDSKLLLYIGNGDGTFQDEQLIYQALGSHEASSYAIPTRICPWYVF